jgi:hypothetical protein
MTENKINILYLTQKNDEISREHFNILGNFGQVKTYPIDTVDKDLDLLEKVDLLVVNVFYECEKTEFILSKANSLSKKIVIVYDSCNSNNKDYIIDMIKLGNFSSIEEEGGYDGFGGELHFAVSTREIIEKELDIIKSKIFIIGTLENKKIIEKISKTFKLPYVDIIEKSKFYSEEKEPVYKMISDILSDTKLISNGYILFNIPCVKELEKLLLKEYTKPNFIVKLFDDNKKVNLRKYEIPYIELNSKINEEEELTLILYNFFNNTF